MAARVDRPPPTPLERLLARDRWLIAASLSLLAVLAWVYLIVMARQMATGDMSLLGMPAMPPTPAALDGGEMPAMPGMPDMPDMPDMPGMAAQMAEAMTMAPAPWSARIFMLTFLMWWVMMIGMMIPSAVPMVSLFGGVQRRQLAEQNPALRVAAFTIGYVAVWGAFSVLAASAQWALSELALLSQMQFTVGRGLGALLLALAGIYQLAPLKNVCLRRCRSPAEFLSTHWRQGTAGAFRMGAEHGAFCVGCCWLLMGLLFVGGVMNLFWVAAIGVFVLLEKLMPRGERLARASGVAMLAFAGYLLL
jgi:predicted metal-binding membrane protein